MPLKKFNVYLKHGPHDGEYVKEEDPTCDIFFIAPTKLPSFNTNDPTEYEPASRYLYKRINPTLAHYMGRTA